MPNPRIPLGTLNRIRASIVIPGAPELNVTSSFLGQAGISLGFTGETTQMLPQMTGVVTSPEPYQMAQLSAQLVRSQALASLYKQRMELNALLGDLTVIPDAAALEPYQLVNCAIQAVRELPMTGSDASFTITIAGTYFINSSLWDAV